MVSQSITTVVEKQLLRQQLHFTLTEAAGLTGLSMDEAREALDPLLTRYVCRLQVSENGDLIYNFGPTLRRRGAKTLAERRQEIVAWLWKGFTVVYKAWIALTLVVYFVLFLVILLLIILASSAKQMSDDRRRSSSLHLSSLLQMFAAIFQWRTVTGAFDYRHDRYGYRYRAYRPKPGALNTNRKSFVAAVYDFVFGPPRPVLDPLQNEREVAAYLQQQKGLVVASELSALAGWTLPQAETFLTDCVIRYRGETRISDNAVLYGEFNTLIRSVGDGQAGDVVHYWDEYEPEYELNGNSTVYNGIIACMNGFNLLFAILVLSGSLDRLIRGSNMVQFAPEVVRLAHGPLIPVVLGWLPLGFSVLFFVIPGVRLLRLQVRQRRRRQQNMRKRLYKAIFTTQGQPQPLRQVLASVNAKTQEETLSRQVVEDMLQELTLDLAGDMTINDRAEVIYAFPRITRELREVEHLRQQHRVDKALGGIILESDNVVEPNI